MEYTNREINVAIAERIFLWRWYSVYPRTLDCNSVDRTKRVKMLGMSKNTPGWGPSYGVRDPFQATICLKYDVIECFGPSMEPEELEEKDYSKYVTYGDEPGHIDKYYIGSFSSEHKGFKWDYFVPHYVEEIVRFPNIVEQLVENGYKVDVRYSHEIKSFICSIYKEGSTSIFARRLNNMIYCGEDPGLSVALCLAAMQIDLRK